LMDDRVVVEVPHTWPISASFAETVRASRFAIVRKRLFESAADAKINPLYASRMWHDAMHGDAEARELIEQLCGVEIVDGDTPFGFL
jgi:hypothetical protein